MKQSIYILIFIVIYFGIDHIAPAKVVEEMSTLLIGIMLLTSYLLSNIAKKVGLPRLSGYMIMGTILGASGLGILKSEIMENMQFLENLALSFIALTAGGELRFRQVKQNKKTILYILIGQIVIIFSGMVVVFYIISGQIPYLQQFSSYIILGLAILYAGTALSTSPATTMGIITELQSEGRVTNIVLIITVLKAIFLILIFPIIITLSKTFFYDNVSINFALFRGIFVQLLISVGSGVIIGGIIIWYIKKVKVETSLFLLGTILAITEISSLFGLDILLTSIVAGIVVQNFSSHGQSLISGIEIFSLPIYVIFFCFAGASLHLDLLGDAFIVTILLVIARFLLNYAGNYLGAFLAKEDRVVKNVSWMGYIGQAGVALGLGIVIKQNLPAQVGQYFFTILISTVVINEMLGPVLLKYVFIKAKEAKISE